jgi:hypothetical protein
MLWNYAPAADMVGDRPVDGVFGAGGRHLQVGRRRRGGSLLRSGFAWRRKNRHRNFLGSGLGSAQCNRVHRAGTAKARGRRPELRRIFDHLTGAGSNVFRRRCRVRALESQPFASAQSIHHVALERQATGFPAERSIVCAAASGSRHVCAGRYDHRSANQRITDQQQRHVLRASALSAVAAVATAQIAVSLRLADAQLVG